MGSLIVNVGANIAGFEKGMGGITKSLGGLMKFAGPAAIGYGFKAMVDGAENTIAAQTKLAAKLGTTQSFVAGMDLGMKRLGLSTDDLGGAFRHLQAEIGEAGVQGSEAAKKFQRFGIDASKFKAGDMQGNLGIIADRFKAINDPAQRMAAQMAILTRHGMALAPALSQGSAGLRQMERDAIGLGTALSEGDAARVTQGVRAWQKARADMAAAQEGFGAKLAVDTAGDKIPKFLSAFAESGAEIGAGFLANLQVIGTAIRNVTSIAGAQAIVQEHKAAEGKAAVKALKQEQNDLDRIAKQMAGNKATEDLTAKLNDEAAAHTKVANAADFAKAARAGATAAQLAPLRAKAELEAFNQTTQAMNEKYRDMILIFEEMPEKIDAAKAAEAGYTKAHQDAIEAESKFQRQQGERFKTFNETITPLEAFNKKLEDQQALLALNTNYWETYARSIGTAAQELMRAGGLGQTQLPGAAAKGSREEYSIIAKSEASIRDPIRLLDQTMKQMLATEQAHKKVSEQIASYLSQPQFGVVTGRP